MKQTKLLEEPCDDLQIEQIDREISEFQQELDRIQELKSYFQELTRDCLQAYSTKTHTSRSLREFKFSHGGSQFPHHTSSNLV